MDLIAPAIARYAVAHTTPLDDELARIATVTRERMPHPGMMSGLVEARLLQALLFAAGATHVLEIGTFTGLGALAMAQAVGSQGRVTTIEADEQTAALAREHLDAHPDGGRVELLVGDARELLRELQGPFDLVYVDAWKPDYPAYFELSLPLLTPRGVLVFDNALRDGRVLEEGEEMAAFNDAVHADPRVRNALLTVGDGMLLAWPA